MKTKAKKRKVVKRTAKKARTKKKPEPKPVQRWEMYRVNMEVQKTENGQLVGYAFDPHPRGGPTDEETARELAAELKIMGKGGQLIHLDGSPDGLVVESWAGVGRVVEATVIEKQALEQEGK